MKNTFTNLHIRVVVIVKTQKKFFLREKSTCNAHLICENISQSYQWAFTLKSHRKHAPSNQPFFLKMTIYIKILTVFNY